MTDLPSGLVSFLMTDIEDSTRHWERDPASMQICQQLHDQMLNSAISARHGIVFKNLGDGCLAVFADPVDAARAAVAAQTQLTKADWPGEEPLRVRMSLHAGEAIPVSGDYQTVALNRVARLNGAGHGGQILISDRFAGMIRPRLPDDVELVDLGRHLLPGLVDSDHIWQVNAPGLADRFPALESLAPPTNLPITPDRLIGREETLQALTELVTAPPGGVVTITGPGGVGKTRIALELGHALRERFPDGVWLIDLSPVRDPELVASTIAEVLGIRTEREGGAEQALSRYLSNREVLLILDNFEQVQRAGPVITSLLAASAGLRIVVTSRIALGVRGEREVALKPLELAIAGHGNTAASVASPAVDLFSERARAVNSDFTINDENAADVAELCTELDGLPLAIELAAARIRALSVPEIMRQMEDALAFLSRGPADAPQRQQTLRAAIGWSDALLNPKQREAFYRFAVFTGPAVRDAIGAVWQMADPIETLEDLLKHNLIRREDGADGVVRFRMLETIRAYASDGLLQTGKMQSTSQLHASWFLGVLRQAEAGLQGTSQLEWMARVSADQDNARSALEWALRHQPPLAPGAVSALWRFWSRRGRLGENFAWLERLLAEATDSISEESAEIVQVLANMANEMDDLPRAMALYDRSRANWHVLGNRQREAAALQGKGRALAAGGRLDEARQHHEQALLLLDRTNDPVRFAFCLDSVADVLVARGEYQDAMQLHLEALALLEPTGDPLMTGYSYQRLGIVSRKMGALDRAEDYLDQTETRMRAGDDSFGLTMVNFERALVLLERKEHQAAAPALQESLEQFNKHGSTVLQIQCLEALASVYFRLHESGRVAVLLSSCAKEREHLQIPLPLDVSAAHSQVLAGARNTLGDEQFNSAWQAGRNRSFAEVVRSEFPVQSASS